MSDKEGGASSSDVTRRKNVASSTRLLAAAEVRSVDNTIKALAFKTFPAQWFGMPVAREVRQRHHRLGYLFLRIPIVGTRVYLLDVFGKQ